MATRIGINGFGRIGRLALRAAWDWPELEITHINEIGGDVDTAAHLLKYDSVHGTWPKKVDVAGDHLMIDGTTVSYTSVADIGAEHWQKSEVDVLVECTGQFKSKEKLSPAFARGIKKIVVSAPIKQDVLNIVMGVNDDLYESQDIVTAASCTTNCLAPVLDVMLAEFGVRHASVTTIHDITNTQSVLDEFHKDLRRARASSMSLIPTSTGSASAIAEIFPQLKGRINGLAVRVPLANASLTDCVFEVAKPVSREQVNQALQRAADGRLKGVLGYETRPLVSVDFTDDTRSGIVDALSTMVVNDTQVKLLVWYDNEIGYVNRMMELALKVGTSIR